jgi:hypothetical protein
LGDQVDSEVVLEGINSENYDSENDYFIRQNKLIDNSISTGFNIFPHLK